jgi:hypothetical protein
MDNERRRAPRHPFGGVVELSAADPIAYVIAKTTELGPLGCFVGTAQSLPVGTSVSLKISHGVAEFNATGKVVYVLAQKGMGIGFAATSHDDQRLLEEWLKQSGAG